MNYKLPVLPFHHDELDTFLSSETFDFHHGVHHRGYIENLNRLIPGSALQNRSLLEIMRLATGPIFNNAAQSWNHTFYWHSITTRYQSHQTTKKFSKDCSIDDRTLDGLKELFLESGKSVFGSGWVWLLRNSAGGLEITTTSNADVPFLTDPLVPLFVCDVWEHAYYIDYRNRRASYLEDFWQHINWQFVSENYKRNEVIGLDHFMIDEAIATNRSKTSQNSATSLAR